MLAAASVRNVGTTAAPSIAGSASSTWWPSSAQSRAVSAQHAQALRVHRRAVRRPGREGDAQRAGIGADLLQERSRRRRRGVGIAGARAARSRRAARRCRARVSVTACSAEQPPSPSPAYGRHGVAPARRLEPDQPAARGRRADRAEAVGGVGHRQHARAHRGRRAAARAAGDAREVPRVPRRPVQLRLAGEREPELAGVGAAEDDEAGALEPRRRARCRRPAAGRRRRSASSRVMRHAGERGREVLHEERHAAERPVGQARRRWPCAP